MDRRKFLTGIAGIAASGAVLAKDPITTQLSPPKFRHDGLGKWRNSHGASIVKYIWEGDRLNDRGKMQYTVTRTRNGGLRLTPNDG